jgi:type II secretory pathway pseudopilin PulG
MHFRIGRQAGVSMLETTVVVFVIGILALVATQSQRLADYMTAKRLAAEMRELETMVHAYRERYGAMPGDDTRAPQYLPGAVVADSHHSHANNGRFDGFGPWSGVRRLSATYNSNERAVFWNHVRLAGLASGDPKNGFALNAVNGRLGVYSGLGGPRRPAGTWGIHAVCSAHIEGAMARMMDRAMDDGDAEHGQVWAGKENGMETTADFLSESEGVSDERAPTPYVTGERYTVCKAF